MYFFYFWYFSISFCICAHAGGDKHKFIFVYFFLLVFLNLHFVFVYMQVETIIISDFCSLPFGIFVDKNHSISEYIMERFWTTSRRRRTTLWSYQYPRCCYRCFDKNYLKKKLSPKSFLLQITLSKNVALSRNVLLREDSQSWGNLSDWANEAPGEF